MSDEYLFFETMLDNISESLYILDDKGNYIFVNSSYVKITGISREVALKSNVYDLLEDGQYDKCVSDIVYKTKKKVTVFQDVYIAGNKKLRQIVKSTPIFDDNGNVKNIVATAKPICSISEEYEEAVQNDMVSNLYVKPSFESENPKVIAVSKKMKEILKIADRVSDVDSSVLIYGESGSGKEVIAHYIHDRSERRNKKIIEINCASLPESLLESELFGYEKNSFTGASRQGKKGIIEEAEGGTLFLDEINSMSLNLQGKLLRVLETKMVQRIGSVQEKYVNFRLIAATNCDLKECVNEGKFRMDLYYRLSVIPLNVPNLRDRVEDVVPLAIFFLKYYCDKYNRVKTFSKNLFNIMLEYEWPGNVRELKNFVERMIVMSSENVIEINDVPDSMFTGNINCIYKSKSDKKPIFIEQKDAFKWLEQEGFSMKCYLEKCEKELIEDVLKKYGSTYKAAKILKMSQPTLVRRKEKYKINY